MKQPMLLKTRLAGDPVLRQKGRTLSADEILSPEIQYLIECMRETLRDAPGVGLAAPQIGESLQLAVIEDRAEYQKGLSESDLQERERKPVAFHVIVNPVLEMLSPAGVSFHEGCLSIPGLMSRVPRARSVRVTCLDEKAQSRVIEAHGWYARILQHEIDHLNGTLYVDRMESHALTTIENYQRQAKAVPKR